MSHDLRGPLRSIRSFADVLREDAAARLSADDHHLLDRVIASADRMSTQLNDLLSYCKAAGVAVPSERVRVFNAVRHAIEALQAEIEDRQAKMLIDVDDEVVLANPTLLQQVLHNLISNALKFVPRDRKPEIAIRAVRSDQTVRIAIEDNGIGTVPEERRKLFMPFQRLGNATEFPGTGLGLALVARAVERMNGSVGAESKEEQGSIFWFELPAGQPARGPS